jgi:DNA-binding IclR family transcriptional regulator
MKKDIRLRKAAIGTRQESGATAQKNQANLAGTQTLGRGLDLLDAVARAGMRLQELATTLGLARNTTHRLAGTLVRYRYLKLSHSGSYSLGPRLLELGYRAGQQANLTRLARSHLERLSALTGDAVHLAVLDDLTVFYIDKIPGMRRVEISSRVGERQPVRSTGLGKALILDCDETQWRDFYDHETRLGNGYGVELPLWLRRMKDYAKGGYAFDIEENEDQIRCVAVPVRDASGAIVGAISVASAAQYMDDTRMHKLVADVKRCANAISTGLGYAGPGSAAGPRRERREESAA